MLQKATWLIMVVLALMVIAPYTPLVEGFSDRYVRGLIAMGCLLFTFAWMSYLDYED